MTVNRKEDMSTVPTAERPGADGGSIYEIRLNLNKGLITQYDILA